MTAGKEHADQSRRYADRPATVIETLTNGMFRLQMSDGRHVVAHVAKDLRMALSRLLPGDPVLVDVSPYDPGKARICKLLSKATNSQHESPPDRIHGHSTHTSPSHSAPPTHPNQRELS